MAIKIFGPASVVPKRRTTSIMDFLGEGKASECKCEGECGSECGCEGEYGSKRECECECECECDHMPQHT